MMTSTKQKTILFVGASGNMAKRIIPLLADQYSIIGLSQSRTDLSRYCTQFYTANLLTEHEEIFKRVFSSHAIDICVWNAVRYFPKPILESSREILHTEFDLAVALPLACLQIARENGFTQNRTFVFISSLLAFGVKERWGSYSIAKAGEIILSEYLAREIKNTDISIKTIALGSLEQLSSEKILSAFTHSFSSASSNETVYKLV